MRGAAFLREFLFQLIVLACVSFLPAAGQAHKGRAPRSSSANVQFQAALAAYHSQQYEKAEADLKPLLQSDPNSFEVNELAGLVYVAQKQFEKANLYLAKAVKLNPKLLEARTAFATNLLRLNRPAEAEAEFRKARELSPSSFDANHNLGEFYIQTGNIPAAIPFLKRAQEINPSSYDNGYDLTLAYEQNNELESARDSLRRLMQLHNSAELHSLMGEIEEKSRNFLQAAKEYEQAARLDPTETNLLNWGAELLLHQTFEPAIQVFTAALERYPQSERLQNGLGIAFYGLGRFEEAGKAFLHASDLNPSDPLPISFLGQGYDNLSAGMGPEIQERLKEFLDRHPGNARLTYYYAMSLFRQNQARKDPGLDAQIEKLLKSALALDPGFADAHLQLGIIYSNQQKYSDAIAQFGEALKSSPNSASTHYRLGQALAKSGETERAKQEFALFERLRQTEAEESAKEHNQVQQFVYSIRKSGDEGQN